MQTPGDGPRAKATALNNGKGGVGKTTTTGNLVHARKRRHPDRQLLMVDTDPQANLTEWLAARNDRGEFTWEGLTIADVMWYPQRVREAIGPSRIPGVDLLYGSPNLGDVADQIRLNHKTPSSIIRRLLRELEYDEIYIDTPPNLGVLSIGAMVAADRIIIPIDSKPFSLNGLQSQRAILAELVEQEAVPRAPAVLVLPTMVHHNAYVSREVNRALREIVGHQLPADAVGTGEILTVIEKGYDVLPKTRPEPTPRDIEEARKKIAAATAAHERLLNTTIPVNSALPESQLAHETIFEYDPRSSGALAYAALAEELDG